MPQPPYAARLTNFLRDANAGLESPAPLSVDAELNAILNVVNQLVLRERQKTNSDGTLKNVASATAQSLAGVQVFTATASQTTYTTTIVWSAAFTTSNVFVFISGLKVAVTSVANNGGFLEVVIAAQTVGTQVTICAFESGAGVLTRLQTAGSGTEGAHLVAIQDVGSKFVGVTVEAALQEEATAREALATAIGNTADLIRRTGTVAFTANQSLGGFRLTNVGDGVGSQDAVTMNQFAAYTAVWDALEAYYMRLDGTTPMGANLPMGNNRITGMADGTASTDGATKGQVDLKLNLTGGTLTGDLDMGTNSITNLADPVNETDAINLQTARTLVAAFATRAQFPTAGTSSFTVPAGVSKIRVRAWGAGGGGLAVGDNANGWGGGGGAYTEATLSVTAGESLTVITGAGGAVDTTGGDTQVLRGATVLMSSGGGKRGTLEGVGGTYTFDAGVSGFGINGGSANNSYRQGGNGDPILSAQGGASPMGGSGGRGGSGAQSAGIAPGGGGSGGWGSANAGAAGRVEIEY